MNVGKVNDYSAPVQNNTSKTSIEANQKKSSTLAADNVENKDKFEKDTPYYSPAYTKGSSKSSSADNVFKGSGAKSVIHMKNEAMQSLVQKTLSGQAGKGSPIGIGGYRPISSDATILNALQAAEATSEGKDYWGVEATAERIFTFAKTLAGEDLDQLQKMRDAFDEGFKQASGSFKGGLPSISYQTRDKVYEMFDSYEKELQDKKAVNETDETTETQSQE
ncbi:MAG: hypothetical protein LBR74_07325 [Eubacterium sp.]|jgi:hypothetical protein|nr:hypothetical protein [Eubacterium sp.]